MAASLRIQFVSCASLKVAWKPMIEMRALGLTECVLACDVTIFTILVMFLDTTLS